MQTNSKQLIWIFVLISVALHALLLLTWNTNNIQLAPLQTDLSLKLDAYITNASAASKPNPPAAEKTLAKPATYNKIVRAAPAVTVKPTIKTAALPDKKTIVQPSTKIQPPLHEKTESVSDSNTEATAAEHNKLATRIQHQLHAKLEFFHHYPRIAIRNAWEGQVDLGIRVQANGTLGKVYIIQSSGYNLLDKAAINSVHKVAVLPDASYWLNGQHIDVILPVIYKLSDKRS